MSVFKLFKNECIGGEIKYYGLTEWWLNCLTEEERDIICKIYQPMIIGQEYGTYALDKGNITKSSQTKLSFLGGLASWFTKDEHYNIAIKIIKIAEDEYQKSNNLINKHYFCVNAISVYYRFREISAENMSKAIHYCEEQIKLAPLMEPIFLNEISPYKLPTHPGYKQLAIIYEKQKKYKEALEISKEAYNRGWNIDDASKRIDRLNKKINNTK